MHIGNVGDICTSIKQLPGEGWQQLLFKINNAVIEHTKGKTTNWEAVTRSVLQTKPKNADYVPDMVDWYKRYGGGTKTHVVNELSMFFDKFVPATRVVSGSFFKQLAGLKWGATHALPTKIVNAILVVHAAASEEVSDDIAKFIRQKSVDAISFGGKKHDEAMRFNESLVRAAKLCKDSSLQDIATLQARFDLMDRLVRILFKYDPNKESDCVDPKFVTCDACVGQFVQDLMRLSPQVTGLTEPEVSTAAADAAPSHGSSNIVGYEDDGAAQSMGRMTLDNKGYTVGKIVNLAKGERDQQWEITDVDNAGDVYLCKLGIDGERHGTTKVPLSEFVAKYKVCKDKLATMKEYPANDATNSSEFFEHMLKGIAVTCVYGLAQKHVVHSFQIMIAPIKRVNVTASFGVGELILVPATHNVALKTDQKKAASDTFICTLKDEPNKPELILSKPTGVQYTSPIWKLRVSHDKEKANCEITVVKGPYKPAMNPASKLRDCIVQCVINFKPLNVGDEVILFREEQQKQVVKKNVVMADFGAVATRKKPRTN